MSVVTTGPASTPTSGPAAPDIAISVRHLGKRYTRGQDEGWSLHGSLRSLARTILRSKTADPNRHSETFLALDDVTFDVAYGERVGVIGRNGAGKSTLLKILSRIIYPTRGEARVRGRLTSLLEVGTGFNETLTGRENVYINASIHGLTRSEIDERFEDIVEFSGVRPFIDTPVKRYSSGMHVRLAFAVAAHLDPDILLLDEVLAVGDLSFQQKCLERGEGMVSEGRTLLFVSHSLDAIARFCTRCIWLDQGRMLMDGPVGEVLEAYLEEVSGIRAAQSWAADLPDEPEAGAGEPASASDERHRAAPATNGTEQRHADGPSDAPFTVLADEAGEIVISDGDGASEQSTRDALAAGATTGTAGTTDTADTAGTAGAGSVDTAPTTPTTPVVAATATGAIASGATVASMPGDDDARLVRVRVVNKDGRSVSSVLIDEPFAIEVTFDVLRPGKNVQPALHFKNDAEHYLFVVACTDPAWMTAPPPPGRHVTTAWVPAHLMNAGVVHITVALATPDPFERHCVVERAVSFNVFERFGDTSSARGLYSRNFPGVVRPRLQWETRRNATEPSRAAPSRPDAAARALPASGRPSDG